MSLWMFITSVLALLMAPGPTNTLMGVAGAEGGFGRVVRLLPAELTGYLMAIGLVGLFGGHVLAQWPLVENGLKLAAALWVMVLAVMLWGRGSQQREVVDVSGGRVLVTTLLNPKALIFGLVLLPKPFEADYGTRLALFLLCVIGVAFLWGSLGHTVHASGGRQRLQLVERIASVWLAMVSVLLVAGAVRI